MIVRALRRTTVLALVSASLLLGGVTPAQAEAVGVRDGQDTSLDADIQRVRVAHDGGLVVRVHLDRLRATKRQVVQGMNVYVDLRSRNPGPELYVESGLWARGDHVVTRARGWAWGSVLECRSSLRTDPERDVAVLRLTSSCLPERHPRARVGVLTYEDDSDSNWLGERRTYTPWGRARLTADPARPRSLGP